MSGNKNSGTNQETGALYLGLSQLRVPVDKPGPWQVWARATLCVEEGKDASIVGAAVPEWWKAHVQPTAQWTTGKVQADVFKDHTAESSYLLNANLQHDLSRSRQFALDSQTMTLLANTSLKLEVLGFNGTEEALSTTMADTASVTSSIPLNAAPTTTTKAGSNRRQSGAQQQQQQQQQQASSSSSSTTSASASASGSAAANAAGGPATQPSTGMGVNEVVLGSACVPLRTLLSTPCINTEVTIKPGAPPNDGALWVRLYADDDMAEFLIGSTVVQVPSASLESLPPSWCLPPPPDTPPDQLEQALIALAEGPLPPKQAYTITITGCGLPCALTLPGGKLFYRGNGAWCVRWGLNIAESEAAAAAEVKRGADGIGIEAEGTAAGKQDENAGAEKKEGKDEDRRAPAKIRTSAHVWLPQEVVRKMQESLQEDEPLRANVQWKGLLPPLDNAAADPKKKGASVKKPAKGAPEEREVSMDVKASLSLSHFLAPGSTSATLESPVDTDNDTETHTHTLRVTLHTSHPLTSCVYDPKITLTPLDVLPVRKLVPHKPPRDVEAEMQKEIRDIVRELTQEYVQQFMVGGNTDNDHGGSGGNNNNNNGNNAKRPSLQSSASGGAGEKNKRGAAAALDEKRKLFFYHLNTTGLYHQLKERLKPRIQRLVRQRFGRAPQDQREKDEFLAKLYNTLTEQVNQVVMKQIKETKDANEDPVFETPFPETARRSRERLRELSMLAVDAEAAEEWDNAALCHEDRVTIATSLFESEGESAGPLLSEAYTSLGLYLLRVPSDAHTHAHTTHTGVCVSGAAQTCASGGVKERRARTREALREALSLDTSEVHVMHAYAALLLEQGQYEDAKNVLVAVTNKRQPSGDGSGEQDSAATSLTHVLLMLHADIGKDIVATRVSLQRAVAAFGNDQLDELGVPRRTTVVVLLEAADFLVRFNLCALAHRALSLSDVCEAAAVEKAKERGLQVVTPVHIRAKQRRIRAQTHMLVRVSERDGSGNSAEKEAQEALAEAQHATDIGPDDGWAWSTLGKIQRKLGLLPEATTSFARALDALTRGGAQVPLSLLFALSDLYVVQGDYDRAKEVMLRCCAEYTTAKGWLKVGIICFKLNEFEDAEDALQEANVLDNRDPEVWGYLSLLLLTSTGEARVNEAAAALKQALRHNLRSPSLLRELASAWIALDDLTTAEDLLRRSLACEGVTHTHPAHSSVYTRRLLADVLASQRSLQQAAQQYRQLLKDVMDGKVSEDAVNVDEVRDNLRQVLDALGRGLEEGEDVQEEEDAAHEAAYGYAQEAMMA